MEKKQKPPRGAKVIALANQKGCYVPVAHVQHGPERMRRRTAKTTSAVNLGIGLADQGKRVLLVDADPQGDLTTALGWTDADSLDVTLVSDDGIGDIVIGEEVADSREDSISYRMLHWHFTMEQKEELKRAMAVRVPKKVILSYFYPETSVAKMMEIRRQYE